MTKIRKGKRKPRAVRPESKNLVVGYDSNWEYELHTGILDSWSCHTDKLPYTVDHHYHPDFIREIEGKKMHEWEHNKVTITRGQRIPNPTGINWGSQNVLDSPYSPHLPL